MTVSVQRALIGSTATVTVASFPFTIRSWPPMNFTVSARPLADAVNPPTATSVARASRDRSLVVVLADIGAAAPRGPFPTSLLRPTLMTLDRGTLSRARAQQWRQGDHTG